MGRTIFLELLPVRGVYRDMATKKDSMQKLTEFLANKDMYFRYDVGPSGDFLILRLYSAASGGGGCLYSVHGTTGFDALLEDLLRVAGKK